MRKHHFQAGRQLSRKVIAISVEGLSSSLAGPYGSNTAVTPTLNSFAARGIVLDQCFLDSRSSSENWLSLWTAQHALNQSAETRKTLWQLIQEAGGTGLLITDCHQTAELGEEMGCEQVCLVKPPEVLEPAEETTDCCLMSLFSEAAAIVAGIADRFDEHPVLIWIHSRGLRLPWDAPLALRQRFADPQDPDPPTEVAPPGFGIDAKTDPDLVVGWGQVAAAQVAVVDQAIELLVATLAEIIPDCAWCLLGLRGVPLGEHDWVGWGRSRLFNEELNVPVLIIPSPPLPIGIRSAMLCQLPDISTSIAELCGLNWPDAIWGHSEIDLISNLNPSNWNPSQQIIGLVDETEAWIRVPAWSLTYSHTGKNFLYVKPDDRWEVNDVSVRCAEIIAQLRELAENFFHVAQRGDRSSLAVLDENLCNLLR